jgi:hypothetical protein
MCLTLEVVLCLEHLNSEVEATLRHCYGPGTMQKIFSFKLYKLFIDASSGSFNPEKQGDTCQLSDIFAGVTVGLVSLMCACFPMAFTEMIR